MRRPLPTSRPPFLVLVTFVALLPCAAAHAGRVPPGDDDVLRPVPHRPSAGLYLMGGMALSAGTFSTLCDCTYGSGDGLAYAFGAVGTWPAGGVLSLVGRFGYHAFGMDAGYTDSRWVYDPGTGNTALVDYGRDLEVSVNYLQLGAAGRMATTLAGLWIEAGVEFGVYLHGSVYETETITTPGYVYDTGGASEQVLLDEALSTHFDPVAVRLALQGGVGYDIPVTRTITLAPSVRASLPLTAIATGAQAWRATAILGALEARMSF